MSSLGCSAPHHVHWGRSTCPVPPQCKGGPRGQYLPGLRSTAQRRNGPWIAHMAQRIGTPRPDIAVLIRPCGDQRSDGRLSKACEGFCRTLPGRSPGFLEGGLPGKLIQHIAEGFDTDIASMRLGIMAALVCHRRGAGECLHTGRARISPPIVAPSCQQPGRKTLAGAWEARKDWAVKLAQKKAADFHVVLLDLLQERRKLAYQGAH